MENELNKLQRELESIETTLSGDETEKINFRKNEMKELVTKAEYLRDASVNLQKKISTARDLSNSKEEQLVDIRNELKSLKNRSFDLNSSDARDNLKDKEQQIENDISEIAEMIEEMEYQYKTVIDDFEDADIKITQIEKEIIELKGSSGLVDSTPKWKEDTGKYRRTPTGGELKRPKSQQSDRLSRGFSIDKDTELFLHKRKEEIIDLIPDLDYKKQGLRSESQRLNKKKEDLKRIIEEKEDLIQDRHSKIEECELFIAKFNTSTSPMRGGGNNTKRMWESLRSLWGLVSENPWDGESEDIPKAIIKWSDYMKDQLSKKLMDSDRFVQLAAQQRIDQATIQHLNAKFQELNEELNKRPNNEKSQQDIEKIEIKCQQEIDRLTTRHQQEIDKLLAKHRDEIDRLNAKIDAYREQEIGWNREKKDLDMLLKASDDKVQQLEGQ